MKVSGGRKVRSMWLSADIALTVMIRTSRRAPAGPGRAMDNSTWFAVLGREGEILARGRGQLLRATLRGLRARAPTSFSCHGKTIPHPRRRGHRSGSPAGGPSPRRSGRTASSLAGPSHSSLSTKGLAGPALPGPAEPDETQVLLRPAVRSQMSDPRLDLGRRDDLLRRINLDPLGTPLVADRYCR